MSKAINNSKQKTYLLFFVISFLSLSVQGQDGWNKIRENDWVQARSSFLEALGADSLDKNALEGMIFLSEISQDYLNHQKYVSRYIRHYADEAFVRVYYHLHDGDADKFLTKNKQLPVCVSIAAELEMVEELEKQREAEKAQEKIDHYFNDLKWSFLGPFTSRNGYGYKEEFRPEHYGKEENTVYENKMDMELFWHTPAYQLPADYLNFSHYTGNLTEGSAYFGHTGFTVPSDTIIDLRITRIMPVKIWVDDSLIFQNDQTVSAMWDAESIRLKLNSGKHTILIKSADKDFIGNTSNILAFEESSYKLHADLSYFNSLSNRSNKAFLRLTDTLGYALKLDSSFDPDISTGFEIIEKSHFSFLNNLKNKVEKAERISFDHFLLGKAYLRSQKTREGEAYFYHLHKKQPSSLLIRYVLAKLYAVNGKMDLVYDLLEGYSNKEVIFFALEFDKLDELDMEDDEAEWLKKLEFLNDVTPSSPEVIEKYIEYYEYKDDKDGLKKYIKQLIKKYPSYKPAYESYLDDDKKENDWYSSSESPKERRKAFKKALKKYKKERDHEAFRTIIEYYKDKEQHSKVLSMYDEKIAFNKATVYYRENKGGYLEQIDRDDEAIKVYRDILTINPFETETLRDLADLYKEKENSDSALYFYNMALMYGAEKEYFYNNVRDEIQKIVPSFSYKTLFEKTDTDSLIAIFEGVKSEYKDQDAIVLGYVRNIAIDSLTHVEAFQKMVVKINTPAGVKQWTEYDFDFLGTIQSARVIKSDGKEVRPDMNYGYAVFKNLAPGDVIVVEGKSKYNWRGELYREIYINNYLDFKYPLIYGKLSVAVPRGDTIGYEVHKLDDHLKYRSDTAFSYYDWVYTRLPAVVDEPGSIDEFDRYGGIMISTMTDWSDVVQWYHEKTYGILEPTYEVEEILDTLIDPSMSKKKMVETLYNFITDEVNYSYVSFLQSNYVPKRPGLTCASRIGDCKDVSSLMISMLRQLDIESYYVLVKTAKLFHADMAPSLYFDHVIVGYYLNDTLRFMDLTTDHYPFNVLTGIDVGQVALLVKEGEKDVFRLPNDRIDPDKNKTSIAVDAFLKKDGSVTMDIEITYRGMNAGHLREVISNLSESEIQNLLLEEIGTGIYQNLKIDNYSFSGMDEIGKPLIGRFNARAFSFTDHILGQEIFHVPYASVVYYHSGITAESRQSTLNLKAFTDLSPTEQKVTIHLPDGYAVSSLPKDTDLKSEFGHYVVNFSKKDGEIIVDKTNVFYQQYIEPEKFTDLKKYYLSVLELEDQLIAVRKR